MAHELESGFFGSTDTGARWAAWHNLGTTIDRPVVDTAEAITLAGLDWDVVTVPLAVTMPDGTTATSDREVVQVRADTNQVLGVTSPGYEPLMNRERFSFMDDLIASDEAKWHTAGVLQQSRRVWMLAKIPADVKIAGMDTEALDLYLLLTDGTTGTASLQVAVTPVRVVCMNTLNYALSRTQRQWSARHTTSLKSKMQEARETLRLTYAYVDELQSMADGLISEKMTPSDFREFMSNLMPLPEWTPETDRSWKSISDKRDAITAIYKNAPNLDNVRGTKWAALQAVGEWNDWDSIRDVAIDASPERKAVAAESAWNKRLTRGAIKNHALDLLVTA